MPTSQIVSFPQGDVCEQMKILDKSHVGSARFPPTDSHTQVSIKFVGPKRQLEQRLTLALPFGEFLRNTDFKNMLSRMRALHHLGHPDYRNVDLNGERSPEYEKA